MSFFTVLQELKKRILEDRSLQKVFRNGALVRYGTTKLINFQGCSDLNAVSLSFIPAEEAEFEEDLTFEGPPEPDGESEVEYRILMRVQFEKSEKDRIEDEAGFPGLLEIVRLIKVAIGKDFSLGFSSMMGQRYAAVTYLRGPPITTAEINVAFKECVTVNTRVE